MPSGIVYNLALDKVLLVYLPSVFIAHFDRNGQLGYMEKKGTPDVIESYGFYKNDSEHREALSLCDELDLTNIKKRHVKSKKLTLTTALQDPVIKKAVLRGVSLRMDKFLGQARAHDLPICHNIDRQISLEKIRLRITEQSVSPKLHFAKTAEGIDYTMAIRNANVQWYPSERDIFVICDQPGWIIEDGVIYPLDNLNGNKLKPFLKKRTVHIPNRITHTYLERFVKDIISRASVRSEGFDIIRREHLPKAILETRKNFISEKWVLDVKFAYGDETFSYRIPEHSRTRLTYSGDHDVQFSVIERQPDAEADMIKSLERLGLLLNEDKYLTLPEEGDDSFDLLHWLHHNQQALTTSRTRLVMPKLEGHTLSSDRPKLHISHVENNDWFDIHGVITIGGHEVPFTELVQNIREDNRVFLLPDGTCFIIPMEWMTKYKGLARWAKEEGDGIRVLRSQYTLLDNEEERDKSQSMAVYQVVDHDIDFTVSDRLKAVLRPYQLVGAKWLVSHQTAKLGCCLADDMGLGKTLQTLCALLYAKDNKTTEDTAQITAQMSLFSAAHTAEIKPLRALIIMPASLIFNWHSEIRKFAPSLHALRHIGPKRSTKEKELAAFDIVLTSYQTALRDLDLLSNVVWTYVVLDESQYIKNHNSKIFSAIQEIPSEHKLSLSGTPIENSLSDLWAQMQFINPDILGTYPFFKKHFQIPIEKYQDEHMLNELKKITGPYILRRTKEEVLSDLPEKVEEVIYCEMSAEQSKLYEKEKSAARNLLIQSDISDPQVKMQIFTSLLRLRQLSNHPVLYKKEYAKGSGKFEVLCENLRKITKSGHKALVFSSFTGHLSLVADFLKLENISFVTLTGQSSQKDRQRSVNVFQKDEKVPFFLISIKAGGTGLNLTAADYVFILDPWWNPFIENQAIARAHRIGLKHSLTVHRYISVDTIEEKIQLLQKKKKELSEEVLGTSETPNWNKEELGYLLE